MSIIYDGTLGSEFDDFKNVAKVPCSFVVPLEKRQERRQDTLRIGYQIHPVEPTPGKIDKGKKRRTTTTAMLGQTALLGLAAVLPFTAAQVSSDFESGWDQSAWPTYSLDCSQGGKVTLDSSTAHSGKNSVRVDGAGGYCGHIFFGTTKIPSGDVYVRAYVKASKAFTDSHVSFITMPDSSQGSKKHLRIGGQSKILMYNRESDDATLPDLSPQGIATSAALPTGSWNCFEYHLGTDGTLETWLNNATVAGLTVKKGSTNPNAGQWTRSSFVPKITAVYFGWESYGGDANTFWYDDIVVSSTRVGC